MSSRHVISDLHLFSRRSRGDELLKTYLENIDTPTTLVFNGDTFDFRWTELAGEEETLAAAEAWLLDLLDRLPNTQIHYILGNHDCLNTFRSRLENHARKRPNFHLHEFWLRIDTHFFLHGDCSNRGMNISKLKKYRHSWSTDSPRGEFSKRLYHLVDRTGIGALFHRLYFRQNPTVARVIRYVREVAPDDFKETEHIYFGHTHVPFHDHKSGEIVFHNTGSAIAGMGFSPKQF
ncbi:metallophosphoesterase [Verrucomicrobiaceae bacterium 227]